MPAALKTPPKKHVVGMLQTVESRLDAAAGPLAPGSLPHRAYFAPDGFSVPDVKTLPALLAHAVNVSAGGPFLGHRPCAADGSYGPYSWLSYSDASNRAKNLGCGLVALGLTFGASLGIYSINRPEWTICSLSANRRGFPIVPLYDTLCSDAIKHIAGQTDLSAIACTADKVEALAKAAADLPMLKHIIVMDSEPVPDAATAILSASRQDIVVHKLTDVETNGAKNPVAEPEIVPDTVAVICYTSGTTGLPKGAILTHTNVLSASLSLAYMSENSLFPLLSNTDVHMSYLPLAHVFEFVACALFMYFGARIGFYTGNMLRFMSDVAELKPTVLISVPRIFNRLYSGVMDAVKAKGGVSATLFNMAYKQKLAKMRRGEGNHSTIWDSLVFKSVRMKLGGRVRVIFSGSAPIASDVMDFLRISFSCDVLEGYGQTETAAGISVTLVGDASAGHVGVPLPCCEIRLFDLPEMGYTSKDTPYPRGEICVRGPQVFQGYHKNPDATKAAFHDGGWLATGDVGMWGADGRLLIIDRVKNMFKLAQGEFISPEVIESTYLKGTLLQSIFVYGDPLRSQVVGIVFPKPAEFAEWKKNKKPTGQNIEVSTTTDVRVPSLSKSSSATAAESIPPLDEDTKRLFLEEINKQARTAGLRGFEILGAVHISAEDFSLVDENKTPTWKIRREVVKKTFGEVIDSMYSKLQTQSKK